MAKLTKEILAEKENIEKALEHLQDAMTRPGKSIIELSSIAAFPHNVWLITYKELRDAFYLGSRIFLRI